MFCKHIIRVPEFFCAYTRENGGQPEIPPKDDNYYPVLFVLEKITTPTFVMPHGKNYSDQIKTFTQGKTSIDPSILKKKYIDITGNDVSVNPDIILLNFTNNIITVFDSHKIPHVYPPIYTENLREFYVGKIIIFTIHKLVNPKRVASLCGNHGSPSYIDTRLEKLCRDPRSLTVLEKEQYIVYEAAKRLLSENYIQNRDNQDLIKVVTKLEITEDDFLIEGKETDSSDIKLYVPIKDIFITKRSIYDYYEVPVYDSQGVKTEKIAPGAFAIYIVDNGNTITDRFTSVLDKVIRIPVIRDNITAENGLYVAVVGENGTFVPKKICSLEEINNVSYVYKTQEEAERGANKFELLQSELKQKELEIAALNKEHERIITENKMQLANLEKQMKEFSYQLDMERQRLEAKYQEQLREQELKFLEMKRKLEEESYRSKYHYEDRHYRVKSRYEEEKYERDSTLENIKFGVSLAGLGLGLYALLKK